MRNFLKAAMAALAIGLFAGCSQDDSPVGPSKTQSPPETIPPPSPPPSPGAVEPGLLADLTPLGTLYARSDNWWNLRVDNAPLDPNSASIISTIKGYDHHYVHPDFGGGYGIPYCVVGNETPLVQVSFRNTSESTRAIPADPTGYPIPHRGQDRWPLLREWRWKRWR